MTHTSYTFNPIAITHSPYKQKFAIPRQPGLVTAAHGQIELIADFNQAELIRDIEQHSHLWLLFVFHGTSDYGWKPLVKAPRLGGNKKTGVLATRSTFRPNPIGMSVVKLESVSSHKGKVILNISGLDLLDQTPILDIKPYNPYSDNVPSASSLMAATEQEHHIIISFSDTAKQQLQKYEAMYENLEKFIDQVLSQDPRPAYKKANITLQEYGMSLYDLNIRWQIDQQKCLVLSIEPQDKP